MLFLILSLFLSDRLCIPNLLFQLAKSKRSNSQQGDVLLLKIEPENNNDFQTLPWFLDTHSVFIISILETGNTDFLVHWQTDKLRVAKWQVVAMLGNFSDIFFIPKMKPHVKNGRQFFFIITLNMSTRRYSMERMLPLKTLLNVIAQVVWVDDAYKSHKLTECVCEPKVEDKRKFKKCFKFVFVYDNEPNNYTLFFNALEGSAEPDRSQIDKRPEGFAGPLPLSERERKQYFLSVLPNILISWFQAYSLCRKYHTLLPRFVRKAQLDHWMAFLKLSTRLRPTEAVFIGLATTRRGVSCSQGFQIFSPVFDRDLKHWKLPLPSLFIFSEQNAVGTKSSSCVSKFQVWTFYCYNTVQVLQRNKNSLH